MDDHFLPAEAHRKYSLGVSLDGAESGRSRASSRQLYISPKAESLIERKLE
jgi:hypothetical protein